MTGLGWLPVVFSRKDNSDVLLINQKKLGLSSSKSPTSNTRLDTWMASYVLSEGNSRAGDAAQLQLRRRCEACRLSSEVKSASSSCRDNSNVNRKKGLEFIQLEVCVDRTTAAAATKTAQSSFNRASARRVRRDCFHSPLPGSGVRRGALCFCDNSARSGAPVSDDLPE